MLVFALMANADKDKYGFNQGEEGCSRCQGAMRVIAFIEHDDAIKKNTQAFVALGYKTKTVAACKRSAN